MRLETFQYSEHEGEAQEWILDGLSLGNSNLIVGKNASGKTRILNVISSLAQYLEGRPPSFSGTYDCHFRHGEEVYRYQVRMKDEQVNFERLTVNGRVVLDRGEGGNGKIVAEGLGQEIAFQAPPNGFAAVLRRDKIQHRFLEPLYDWASTLRHYKFGTSLGKGKLAIFTKDAEFDDRDPEKVAGVFKRAKAEFNDAFTNALRRDLASIDYHVSDIGLCLPVSVRVSGAPGELQGLYVKEDDLPGITDQISMSQGMYRVLALLIHMNYCELKKVATCLLVDDIGEGLDFTRSCALIRVLRERAAESNLQLVLSTNDRFVMNEVPIEEWSVIQRKGNHVRVRNYTNSQQIFEDFKFTGMSNFTFLETDFIAEAEGVTKH